MERLAKKESRLKFYHMSFSSHSIDICKKNNALVKYENKWKQKVI